MLPSFLQDSATVIYGLWLSLYPSVHQQPLTTSPKRLHHGPDNRGYWKDGFSIETDYEVEIPEGKLVEYFFTISEAEIAPDGYLTNVTLVNDQFPGPKIEANWGDTIRVTVYNNLTNFNGTSFHWHGIRQFQTNYLDGVPGVTQCPSKPGDTQVYEFRAMQYGTGWYHSHYSLQYTNGARGPVVIHGPSSANYDIDMEPLLITDWYHADAFSYFHEEITDHAHIPTGTLLNGKGVYDCDPARDSRCLSPQGERHKIQFEKGKKHKLRIVSSASLATYKFWVDGHNFTVISTDFVPIKPYVTDVLIVGVAQRYEVIVEANATFDHGSNFWIHGTHCDDMIPVPWDTRIGVIQYDPEDDSEPYTPPPETSHPGYGCRDPPPTSLVPIVPRQVGNNVNGFSPADYLEIGLQSWPNISDPDSTIRKWVLANRTQYVDWREPSLRKLVNDNGRTNFTDGEAPIILDYETGEWVYFVIEGNFTMRDPINDPRPIPRSVHPIHLHGHDFVILAQGDGYFSKDVVPNLDNPARRDTVNLPIGGYVWIAFQINNPGTWLMHCHIAWHASAGLSLQFVEQPSKIKPLVEASGILPELEGRCKDWTEHYNNVNIPQGLIQEDSGI
ncbi:putative Oxidoreductase [Seiridium cardinale]|uniref:Oxidoreductase n=1 Tax=Seiridium cardinale TaxID=138064 RepID=A0ABR2YA34_9PEZI